ncbi:MAG: c-type cytochrome [Verrucomicrobia bacterium]|nr:c-type cytochrome [Verrucomicrobiota bacterium]
MRARSHREAGSEDPAAIHRATRLVKFSWCSLLALYLHTWAISPALPEESAFTELEPQVITRSEALKRLDPARIEGSETLRKILNSVLDASRGNPVFCELSMRFQCLDRAEELMDFAVAHPDHHTSTDVIRFLLRNNLADSIANRLRSSGPSTEADGLVRILSSSGTKEAFHILKNLITNIEVPPDRKKMIIRSMATTRAGSSSLIDIHTSNPLSPELALLASRVLSLTPWESVRSRAGESFPALGNTGAEGFTLAELRLLNADPDRGKSVFTDPVIGCIRCHVIGNSGVAFGPALTLIGEKLSPEALLESILSPSSGIAFGFEAYEIELDTTEVLYGIIASETKDFVMLRDSLGANQKIDSASIVSRQKSAVSAMPQGLAKLMSPQQLADLLAFLESLRGPE